jgi:indole-3-glycerol phosphate synthase
MNILDKIIASKKNEVEEKKESCPVADLEKSPFFIRKIISLKEYLQKPGKSGIIAEFKRQSPSRGTINSHVLLEDVVKGYQHAGASAVSILTDKSFFGGENKDVIEARMLLDIPILRKDFIIDEYQLVEAKSIGADAILLIAAALDPQRLKALAGFAKYLQLEVLMEVHNEKELLDNLHEQIDVIGVNNRNLKDFSESIETSIKLSEIIPEKYTKISESSISKADTIIELKKYGYSGFLIGETFMNQYDPGEECRLLIEDVKRKSVTHHL